MSAFKKSIKSVIESLGIRISRIEKASTNPFMSKGIMRKDWEARGEGYYIKGLDLHLSNVSDAANISYYYAKRIYDLLGGRFRSQDGKLLLSFNGLQFQINDAEELYIINEVFIEEHYNYLNGDDSYALVDIGQNVGITSVFFAAKKNVTKVYGFELFPKTSELTRKNISLNNMQGKIINNSYGLGSSDQELSIPYSSRSKGRMGFDGVPTDIKSDIIQEKVLVKDAYNEIAAIREAEKGNKLVCKIDCEGAEYDILNRLSEKGALSYFDVFLIEWHNNDDPGKLVRYLSDSNFHCVKKTFEEITSGMIYAFKKQ